MRPVLWELALHQLEPVALEGRPQKKVVVPLKFHSTSPPKRALLSVLTASFLVAASPGSDRRACGGASIATGAVRRWRTRPWPLGKPATKRRPGQRQRPIPVSPTSRSVIASRNRNVAIGRHGHVPEPPRSIEQEQRQHQLMVRWFTTNPSRVAHVCKPLRDAPMWREIV